MAIIPLYARIDNLDPATGTRFTLESSEDFDFDQSLNVLSDTRQRELAMQFKRRSDTSYVEAKRSVVATQAKVPYWVGVALVFLGWNEFMTVITNPLYLSVTVMLGGPLTLLWYLNMLGMVQTVGLTMYDRAMVIGGHMSTGTERSPARIQNTGHEDDNDNNRDVHMLQPRPSSRSQSHRKDTRGPEGLDNYE